MFVGENKDPLKRLYFKMGGWPPGPTGQELVQTVGGPVDLPAPLPAFCWEKQFQRLLTSISFKCVVSGSESACV